MEYGSQLSIKVFADGADFDSIIKLAGSPIIKGFTTNPTLARNAGVTDYETFGRKVLAAVPDRPVSLEVLADDFPEMLRQARTIATWGKNVNVKIPVTNTKREFSGDVIRQLSADRVVVECHGHHDGRAGQARRRSSRPRDARNRLGICGTYRRHRRRSSAANGRSAENPP